MNMQLGMIIFAFACIFLGVFPGVLYQSLPYQVDYVPYTGAHIVTQLQLLLFSGLAFFVMLPLMKRTLTISLDFDWFYRRLLPGIANGFILLIEQLINSFKQYVPDLDYSACVSKLNIRLSLSTAMTLVLSVFILSLLYFLN